LHPALGVLLTPTIISFEISERYRIKMKARFVFMGKVLLACMAGLGLGFFATTPAHAQTFSVIHNFTGGNDGGVPYNGFVANGGVFYGTTSTGGASGDGVIFKINSKGTQTVLHSFSGGTDGANPWGQLIRAKSGVLYGTTTGGGASGTGTVFQVSEKDETLLYSFAGGKDGATPLAGLVEDAAGNLYGTTSAGGANGNGTVFKLTAPKTKGAAWAETVLYSFGTGSDGATPYGGLIFDAAGNLYGTTSAGGANAYGTVFQLVPGSPWTEKILYNFQNTDDGGVPYAGLVADKKGNFYGAATEGGSNGGGTVYELTPSAGTWNFNALYSVPGWGISGTFRDVVLDASGNIYASTHCDGANNAGTVYELSPKDGTWNYTLLYTFTGGSDGLYSVSDLVLYENKMYGTTLYGGSDGNGVVYELALN
jgi:uncharacterized repeat protein (TIGR03803 family)